jgi:hypothetical protein
LTVVFVLDDGKVTSSAAAVAAAFDADAFLLAGAGAEPPPIMTLSESPGAAIRAPLLMGIEGSTLPLPPPLVAARASRTNFSTPLGNETSSSAVGSLLAFLPFPPLPRATFNLGAKFPRLPRPVPVDASLPSPPAGVVVVAAAGSVVGSPSVVALLPLLVGGVGVDERVLLVGDVGVLVPRPVPAVASAPSRFPVGLLRIDPSLDVGGVGAIYISVSML